MSELTAKQAAFVAEYLKDLNASAAARRAGYSERSSEQQGMENLRKPYIAAAIAEAMRARQQRTEITQDRVLQELARLAFFDVRKLVSEEGFPIPITQLDDDTARAIVGLDVARVGNNDIGVGEILKFKLADKKSALELLGKHLGMFRERVEVSGKDGGPITSSLDVSGLPTDVLAAIMKARDAAKRG